MKKILVAFLVMSLFFIGSTVLAEESDIYYARCNLKVIKGDYITWINWQASPTFIPVNAKLKVLKGESLIDIETGSRYRLDTGNKGEVYIEKFVTKTPIDIKKFSDDVQVNIGNAVAKVGMTKEEAYIAMGPPAKVLSGPTNNMTYDQIMQANLWIYARRKFGKNIGVEFNPVTGKINRTEGIWGK